MKHKLIGNGNKKNIKETILKNRGIDDIESYLNLSSGCCHDYSLLNNIDDGIKLLEETINNKLPIYIVVDCDADGYCSASIIYNYIRTYLEYDNLHYLIHAEKQHGLSDMEDILNNKENGLIILPDSGTNDMSECSRLSENGFKILILDHHDRECWNNNAVIINNQICDYPNKQLCGTGIVYKFVQALDDYFWNDGADNYIDLVAVANIADDMDLREFETKYLVNIGLQNIKHPLLLSFIDKQSYSISNTSCPTPYDISFYVAPLINAMIRMGEQEEKELMFKAFIKQEENFEYMPRKSKNNPEPKIIEENIYDRVVRLCSNNRAKQSKIYDKALNEIAEYYDEENKKNAICFINATKLESISKELTGLVAMKVADKYDKPCLIIRKNKSKDDKNIIFSGSGRNVHNGIIEDLKQELNNTGLFEYVQGHDNAFGVGIKKENIPVAIDYFNKKYGNGLTEKIYKVDFEFDENIDYISIKEINKLKKLFNKYIEEPLVFISNVYIDSFGFKKMGKNEKIHWKCQVGEVEYVQFNANEDDKVLNAIENNSADNIVLNVVGKVGINMFGNKSTPQVIIEDYEVVKIN